MSAGRLASRPVRPAAGAGPGTGVHRLAGAGRGAPLLVVPAASEGPRPLLVFLHGAGGQGDALVPFAETAAARHGFLVLLPTSVGSTWDVIRGGFGPDVAALDAALADVFAQHAVDRVALGGFSDGGSYALSLGLSNGDLAEAVLAFSPGFAAPSGQVGMPRIFISHGQADTVLPVDRCGRRLARALGEAGYPVRYEEFAGGHVMPPDLVAAGVDWWLAVDGPAGDAEEGPAGDSERV